MALSLAILAGCQKEDATEEATSEQADNDRVRVAMLQPPRSGLNPLTDDAFILSRATMLDSGDPVAYMYSDFACEGSFNIAQLCDPAVDKALSRAANLPTGPERRQAIIEAEAAILKTDAAVPMLHERVIQGEAARVANAVRDPRERELITEHTRLDGASR